MAKKILSILPGLALVILPLVLSGCASGPTGESYFDIPDGPKIIFRGGYGEIVIKYQPPPEPIFKVGNATMFIDFEALRQKYGIVEQPLAISYNVKTSIRFAPAFLKTFAHSLTVDPVVKTSSKGFIKIFFCNCLVIG